VSTASTDVEKWERNRKTGIWADDEEIAIGRTWSDFGDDVIFTVPNLLFEPAPTVGLTVDDVAAMERFVAGL
jgi:hypothetical protein